MIVECCMMERIYQKFFGLLAQRFCEIDDLFKENFIKCFVEHFHAIYKHETNKIRNLAKLYGHLFFTHALDWKIFNIVELTPEATTAASRTFLKILLREMA
jgi:pre-mRNA-splicing factor CWC22